jgi:kynureninase
MNTTVPEGFFHFFTLVSVVLLNAVLPRTVSVRFYVVVVLIVEAVAEFVAPPLLAGRINDTKFKNALRIATAVFTAYCFILSIAFTKTKAEPVQKVVTKKVEEKTAEKKTDTGDKIVLKYPTRVYDKDNTVPQYQIPVYCGTGPTAPEKSFPSAIVDYHKKNSNGVDIYSAEFAKQMDASSTTYRDQFHYPENTTYLCGNSLGLQPKKLSGLVQTELDKWAKYAVKGHFEGEYPWFSIEDYLVEKMAKVVGAKPVEVAVMNSLTSNLHALLIAFYRPSGKRTKILIEESPFPSDMHAITTHILSRDSSINPEDVVIQIGARKGEDLLRTEDIVNLLRSPLGDEIATVMLSGVHFMTGQFFDLKEITRVGHERGIRVGFDLAHATGNIQLQLHDWDVDFACWCAYKYMNAGPGNIAGIFVHERFANASAQELPRLSGWWGHKRATRFTLTNKFDPQPGAAGFQCSNPSVLGCVSLLASLDLFNEATMPKLRAKSELLTSYLQLLLSTNEWQGRIKILTPSDPERRGCQISIRVLRYPVMSVMKFIEERGVVCDEREPDIIRIAPTPLYNTFEDVFKAVQILRDAFKLLDNPTRQEVKKPQVKEVKKEEKKDKKKIDLKLKKKK